MFQGLRPVLLLRISWDGCPHNVSTPDFEYKSLHILLSFVIKRVATKPSWRQDYTSCTLFMLHPHETLHSICYH